MRTHVKKDKIEEALELLNEAAHEKKEEVFEMLEDKYEHLKEVFANAAGNGEALVEETTRKLGKSLHEEEKKIKEAAAQINRKVHKAPWAVLGSVALGALILGLTLGHKK